MMRKKWVLITGVSSGIGHFLANELCLRGYNVLGTVRQLENDYGLNSNIKLFIMDLSDQNSIKLAFDSIKTFLNEDKLYGLINNAGIAVPGPLVELSIEKFRLQMEVNVFGLFSCTQYAYKLMETNSRIINIGSVSGLIVSPFLGAYSISKYSIEAFSDALRRELRLFGIKVILIEPGPLKTKIWGKSIGVAAQFEGSQFSQFLNNADQIIQKTEQQALDIDAILPSILKALESNNPANRYLIHKNKRLVKLIATLFPSKWLDYLINKNLVYKV